MKRVLLVDDEPAVRFGISQYLEGEGFSIDEAGSLKEAKAHLGKGNFDAVLLDVQLPDGDGISFIEDIRTVDAFLPIIVITGFGSIAMAVDAMKKGADHFLTKPVDLRELEVFLNKSLQLGSLRRENRALKTRPNALQPYFGPSPAMKEIMPLVEACIRYPSPVLLRGETGTGKGLMARYIHDRGTFAHEPFVELNCAGLKGEFLESELFGHAKGAFTGAVEAKHGLLEQAHRGTLFLDEIGDMDISVQSKFLKVLEEKRFRPLGKVQEKVSDFRLISATHQDLEVFIREGKFRQDLYFRINTLSITLPPLRDRTDDLPGLVSHLLAHITNRKDLLPLDDTLMALLRSHSWPGNIRELHNALERAWILSGGKGLRSEHLANWITPQIRPQAPVSGDGALDLQSAEKEHIQRVLARTGGKVPQAAKLLGISRATLYRKISQFGIPIPK